MNKVEYKNSSNTKTRIRWWNKAVCIIVGRFQLLARWPGTHSRILSGIQRAAQTILCVYLKRICSRVTNASSALGVLNDYALYKSTHSLTHSLIIYVYRGVRDPPEFGQNRLDVCGWPDVYSARKTSTAKPTKREMEKYCGKIADGGLCRARPAAARRKKRTGNETNPQPGGGRAPTYVT